MTKVKDYYSQELRDYVEGYLGMDFENGETRWKKSRSRWKAGMRAGNIHTHGTGKQYRVLGINGKNYKQPRLLYCFFHKDSFEGLVIDHIDHNSLNDRIGNLRHTSQGENNRNAKRHKTNTSGVTGVSWDGRRQMWKGYIYAEGKQEYLGRFDKLEDAIAARRAAEIEYNYHKNHGRTK